MRQLVTISTVLLICTYAVVWVLLSTYSNGLSARYSTLKAQKSSVDRLAAGTYHQRLVSDIELPAVNSPTFVANDNSVAPDDTVIGIIVDGKPIAFPVEQMGSPSTHIVNFSIDETNLVVTHCNLSNCSRVLKPNVSEILDPEVVQMGGLQENGKMVLLVDDVRYSQDSSALPLNDYDFEVMPFSHWECEHPDSLLYTGEKEIRYNSAP